MGCDIHAMVEAKYRYQHAEMWSWQSCGRVKIWRDYKLFAKIANVRNYDNAAFIAEHRLAGLDPEEFNDEVCSEDFHLWSKDYGVDGHSHSWVTLDELQTADADLAARCRLIVLAHGLNPADARLTFFFEN